MSAPSPRDRSAARLHALAVGLAAFGLFCAQPLVAKLALPRLGGTPAVWNGVSAFFQLALLAAYLGAHALSRRLSPRALGWVYASALLAASALVFVADPQVAFESEATRDASDLASLWIPLGLYMGLPAFALGLSTPLWSRRHVALGLDAPYRLYAASNIGSFAALLLFPFVLDPWLGSTPSWWLWRTGLLALTGLALFAAFRAPPAAAPIAPARAPRVGVREALPWLFHSSLVAALSLALTVHISTDLSPGPWLWSLPLAVYLATWVLAFSRHAEFLRARLVPLAPTLLALELVLVMLEITRPTPAVLATSLACEFMLGLALHLELARRRPPPAQLTAFYAWIGLGGVLGACFVGFASPLLFDRNFDYPALLAACALAFPAKRPDEGVVPRAWLPVASGLLVGLGVWLLAQARGPARPEGSLRPFAFALWLPIFWPAFRWPRASARICAALLLLGTLAFEGRSPALAHARSVAGSYRVVEDPKLALRSMTHGRTVHGSQSTDPAWRDWALPYHHPQSPIAERFDALALRRPEARVAVLGLGVGNMATFARPGWRMLFFEIDPVVEALARRWFDFLARCPACEVRIADGRRGLAAASAEERFDLIVLDAFNSDAVPLHLLTREAMAEYLAALAPGGEIMVHITNRHVDLRRPLADLAAALELHASSAAFDPREPAKREALPLAMRPRVAPTRWVRLARGPAASRAWEPLPPGAAAQAWSDERASIFGALGSSIPESGRAATPR